MREVWQGLRQVRFWWRSEVSKEFMGSGVGFLCFLAYLNGLSPLCNVWLRYLTSWWVGMQDKRESLLDKPLTGKLPRGMQSHSRASMCETVETAYHESEDIKLNCCSKQV
jgi:hypothetical protein